LIHIWDTASGSHIKTLTGHKREGISLIFSPDGKTLVSLCDDRTLRFWHVASGVELIKFQLPVTEMTEASLQFSPDGNVLAAFMANLAGDSLLQTWHAPPLDSIPRPPNADKSRIDENHALTQ
jgi:WD40 repeat protein